MNKATHEMHPTEKQHKVNRRHFMIGTAALLMSDHGMALSSVFDDSQGDIWLSAQGNKSNQYGLSWIANQNLQTTLSGFRGHGLAKHGLNKNTALLFARRPGIEAIEVDVLSGDITNRFRCQPNHHLFGHGCFSADGKLLFTSEANYVTGEGKIGVRDAQSYQLLAEMPSYGVGPHEIKLMPDGKTLAIANGGIQTHPDTGRKKLNLDSMDSSLTYIDVQTGKLLDQFRVAESKASIRHLDVADDGSVAFAMQMQRSAASHDNTVALAGVHKPNQALHVFEQPEPVVFQMNDYAGSVAINSQSRIAGFTSPRGNIAVFWHLDTQEYIGYHGLHDVCGLAVSSDQKNFLISNSNGQLRQLDSVTLQEAKSKRLNMPNTHWDNHLLVMSR